MGHRPSSRSRRRPSPRNRMPASSSARLRSPSAQTRRRYMVQYRSSRLLRTSFRTTQHTRVPFSTTTLCRLQRRHSARLGADPASLYGAVPLVEASSHIIPHDAAYASAVQYHNPVPPSAETFSPPPRVAVRLSRPSDDTGHAGRVSADKSVVPGDFGICGVHQGRGRRVSIAVQRPDAELAGGASGLPGHGKEYVRGHGRGKVRHTASDLTTGNLTRFGVFLEHAFVR